jgi:AAA ATPase domain
MKLKMTNYRRFVDETLDVSDPVIALVGPNEAGKTSLLHALEVVGKDGPKLEFADRTRGSTNSAEITAHYTVDDGDKAALAGIPAGTIVERVTVSHSEEGVGRWVLDPFPHWDIGPRRRCLALLNELAGDPRKAPAPEGISPWTGDVWNHAHEELTRESDRQASNSARLRTLAGRLEAVPDYESEQGTDFDAGHWNELRHRVIAALLEQAEVEDRGPTSSQVRHVLDQRIPRVVLFEQRHRELQRTYVLDNVANDPPAGLANLCKVAELDLVELQRLVSRGTPSVVAVVDRANARLGEVFHDAWRQTKLAPRFGQPTEGTLHLYVDHAESVSYATERSEGLRWFIALHSFLVAQGEDKPIVVVDEAETHLHYDGQADLVDALMNQRTARKVVYSTHSVGCLPPDLGCGIRAVVPVADKERSTISRSYWAIETGQPRVGFSPLLFAMGANLLSLSVPRAAVLVEGPADAILLPTLLREAAGIGYLEYRLAPGIAELPEAAIADLSSHGAQVVVLLDGDAAGREKRSQLERGDFPSDRIFDLSIVATDISLEDLLSTAIFADAVQGEIDAWRLGKCRIDPEAVPTTGRWHWLEEEGDRQGVPLRGLSKPAVAQRAVDMRRDDRERSLLEPAAVESLGELHRQMTAQLGLEAPKGDGGGPP